MKFNTKAIHGGQENIDPAYGPVMFPIHHRRDGFVNASEFRYYDIQDLIAYLKQAIE